MVPTCPPLAAAMSAVKPSRALCEAGAPAASTARNVRGSPPRAAHIAAVKPEEVTTPGDAPAASSACTRGSGGGPEGIYRSSLEGMSV
eukprot:6148740-Pyramimonas_sp.AAC.1